MITIGISIFPEKNSGRPIKYLLGQEAVSEWIDDLRPYGYRIAGFDIDTSSGSTIDYGQRVIMPYDSASAAPVTGLKGTIRKVVEVLRVGEDGLIHGGSIDLVYDLPNGREATLPLISFSNNKSGPNKAYYSEHLIDEMDQQGTKIINIELNFFQFMDSEDPSDTQFDYYLSDNADWTLGVATGAYNNWLIISQNFPENSDDVLTHDIVLSCYSEYGGSYVVSTDRSTTLTDVEEMIRVDNLGIATGGSQIYVRY